MNLQQLIEHYVSFRRALGERCQSTGSMLRAFGRAIGPQADVSEVRVEQVSAFLAGSGSVTLTWHSKYSALSGFYRYAVSRGYVTTIPLPAELPQRPPAFVPYFYSRQELRRLLDATATCRRPRSCLEPVTLRAVVLLLYGAGLRVSEALALDRADVDLENALLTVRQTKFCKTRLVPISLELAHALTQYAASRPAPSSRSGQVVPLFTTRYGERVKQQTLESCFRRLCEHAGIRRADDARYQPRLHDLRHTFAVHRLTSWYRQGADVQQLLPKLSVYLGHVQLACTQVYLSMTPELLAEANARFERYAGKEASHGG
jgi:integrase/recombinase XerD